MFGVLLHGRLGNQMFQYAFAHLCAKKSGNKFLVEVDRHKFYLKPFRLNFPFFLFRFPLFYRSYNFLFKRFSKRFSRLDLRDNKNKLVIPKKLDGLILDGYFQDASFYQYHKEELLKIFRLRASYISSFKNKYSSFFSGQKVLVISMRLGKDYENFILEDLNNAPVFLPADWYKRNLELLAGNHDKVIIISDNPTEVETSLGKSINYQVVDEDPITQFQFLLNANTCVIANSSFAWWGAFLNDKPNKKVYAPKNWAGYNAGVEYPYGIMTPDFIWV